MSSTDHKPRVVCLMGPTASGKSALAVELAQALGGEIVSVDSALVYRQMDIGTAKPTDDERGSIPHHLIDIRDPADPYSVADFLTDVVPLVHDIVERGHLPILTGGTMLYFKALKDGLAEMPPADQTVRDDILNRAESEGWPAIHAELAAVDPRAADRINPNDPQRLQRALEVYLVSGRSLSDWQGEQSGECPFELSELAILPPDRSVLHQRIADRFNAMLAAGLVSEVKTLFERGDLNSQLPAIKSVGYRQVWAHLEGEWDYPTMVHKGIVATRQLAKRQYTWLRGWENLRLLESPLRSEALKILG